MSIRNILVGGAVFLSAASAGASVYLFVENTRLGSELDRLSAARKHSQRAIEERVLALEDDMDARPTSPASEEALSEVRDQVDRLEAEVNTTKKAKPDTKVLRKLVDEAMDKREGALISKVARRVGGQDGSGVSAADLRRDPKLLKALAKETAKSIREQRARRTMEDGKWKPSIEEMQRELDLTDAQADHASEVITRAQERLAEVLMLQLPDGTRMADSLAEVFLGPGDPIAKQAAAQEFFKRLAAEKVPGDDRTYMAVLGEEDQNAKSALAESLTEEQMVEIRSEQFDLFGVKTPDQPLAKMLIKVGRELGYEVPDEIGEDK